MTNPSGPEVARHIAALIDGHLRLTDNGYMSFTASANGDLIHITTADNSRLDAWVLTVEWDGERGDTPANNAPDEAP